MKIGLLGGSFNPPHNGHLTMARAAREAHGLDEVKLVVASRPPHKDAGQLGDFESRFEMAQIAARELPYLSASDIEDGLPGISYTFRTLDIIGSRQPDAEFFFIMGADTVPELATWKNPDRILELAAPVVIPRSGFSPRDTEALRGILPAGQLEILRKSYLGVEPVDISSTVIREKAGRGEDFEHMVPRAVARYINKHGLYR